MLAMVVLNVLKFQTLPHPIQEWTVSEREESTLGSFKELNRIERHLQ